MYLRGEKASPIQKGLAGIFRFVYLEATEVPTGAHDGFERWNGWKKSGGRMTEYVKD